MTSATLTFSSLDQEAELHVQSLDTGYVMLTVDPAGRLAETFMLTAEEFDLLCGFGAMCFGLGAAEAEEENDA